MKSVDEIYRQLLDSFARRAGFVPEDACDLAVRLYAAAAQIQALDIQAEWVLDQSFPQTARGVYLERHAAMRGLGRLPASKATGILRFSVESPPALPVSVPAGPVCMTADERRFQTTEGVTLEAGRTYVDAPAEALEGGSGGNAVAGAVRFLTACPVAVTSCVNPGAFSGGSAAEDDEALRERILESYRRLPNGANAAWYEQTAMSHEGVAAARAVGRARGVGTVDVYIAGENGLPGAALLEEVQADLQERREIAVDVRVKAPAAVPVNVSAAIAVGENADFNEVRARAEQAVINLFTGRMLGRPVLLAELGSRLYALEGVENYRISAPAADLAADGTALPVLGTLSVTELEG